MYNQLSSRHVTICMAAYNEENTIRSVVDGLRHSGFERVIVVDDGSKDFTAAKATGAGAVVIRHTKNLGQWAALRTAFVEALRRNAGIVVTFDADGQHLPDTVPRLLEPLFKGIADVSVASRVRGGWHVRGFHRMLGTTVLNFVLWTLTKHKFVDCTSGLTAIKAEVIREALPSLTEPQYGRLEFWLVVCKGKVRIAEVSATMKPNSRSSKGQLRFALNLVRSVAKTYLLTLAKGNHS